MRKFDWLRKRALWEYKHGAKRFFFFELESNVWGI